MQPSKRKEQPQQIQLELPDYSEAYWKWKQQQEEKKDINNSETIVIIDIY